MQDAGSSHARTPEYVLDSYALLAYFEAESGAAQVRELLEVARDGTCRLSMCAVNMGEVMYVVERERGLPRAQETLARIDELPIGILDADRALALAAAHLKADCPIAHADCFAAALAQARDACLVTGDPEFRKIKPGCNVRIRWLAAQD